MNWQVDPLLVRKKTDEERALVLSAIEDHTGDACFVYADYLEERGLISDAEHWRLTGATRRMEMSIFSSVGLPAHIFRGEE